MKRLIFYNHFGNGDVFESREFIKDWMQRVPADVYLYAHGKRPDLLADIPNLGFTPVTDRMDGMQAVTIDGDDMLVNTWIGRDGKYVLPGIGCVVEKLYEMHNDMLASQGLRPLDRPLVEYIPELNYEDLLTEYQWAWNLNRCVGLKSVLICNGPAQSCQAENFDLEPVIQQLADTYKKILFFTTQETGVIASNICSVVSHNLNQISHLSKFATTIIGRNSGPHVFSQVLPNWRDETKSLVCFTYQMSGACFVANPQALGLKMKVVWSPTTRPDEAFEVIAGCL